MTKTKILDRDNEILRKIAQPVPHGEIGSAKIRNVIERMKEALHAEEDGVAIAAPQIGESLRIFVVSGKAQALSKRAKKTDAEQELNDLIFINPEIVKASKKKRKMEEGCLSVRWLYGKVSRSEKITVKALDESGREIERGASGLMAQIFQHEIDHLNGILFIDKAEDLQEVPPAKNVRMVFFGSSSFSQHVLEELEKQGFYPVHTVDSARDPLPSLDEFKKMEADVFVVASFGKILPKSLIELPKHGSLNVHPSLLPKLRGASPIQNTILENEVPGVTVIKMDEKMDHGPILAQEKVSISPWPDHYAVVEEKLGRAGGRLLGKILENWTAGDISEIVQNDNDATYTKLIRKEDGLLNLNDPAEINLRKVLAYSSWPQAYMIYKNRRGEDMRVIVKDAEIVEGKFTPTRVIPAGKREMNWQDFLRGN